MASITDAYASAEHPEEDAHRTAADIALQGDETLSPDMNIKQAMAVFDRSESEALAVIDDAEHRRVIGLLTEGFALRRYAEELDKVREGLTGGA